MKYNTFFAGINMGVMLTAGFIMFYSKMFVWYSIPLFLLNLLIILWNVKIDEGKTAQEMTG